MTYETWRHELFNQDPGLKPQDFEMSPEFDALPGDKVFDYINRALADSRIHVDYSQDQMGNAIDYIFAPFHSGYPLLYEKIGDEKKRLEGILNLKKLYQNYFNRYCLAPVTDIGNDKGNGTFGYICHMFWDGFPIHPSSSKKQDLQAAQAVLEFAVRSPNDNVIVSALHGLGHWAPYRKEALTAIQNWLKSPTTRNKVVLDYAKAAQAGRIL